MLSWSGSTENKTSIPIAINRLQKERHINACNPNDNDVNILHDDKIENNIARDEVDDWSIAVEVNDQLESKERAHLVTFVLPLGV